MKAVDMRAFNRLIISAMGAAILIVLGGCSTLALGDEKADSSKKDMPRLADPAVTVMPITPKEPARVGRLSQDPIPVYNGPKIAKIELDAYINERGEAIGPTTQYKIIEKGGWNMDALRNPDRSYIPPDNAQEIPTAPGTSYTPYSQSSSELVPTGRPTRLLFDMKDVRITGFTEIAQERQAKATANSDETVLYDKNLGWVRVPKTVFRPGSMSQVPSPVQSIKPDNSKKVIDHKNDSLDVPLNSGSLD
jgi:hypothetical protein